MQGPASFSSAISLKFSPETSSFHRKSAISAPFAEALAKQKRWSTKSESLYDVLRVSCDASVREIKDAYRKVAKLYHPDVSASSMAAMTGAETGNGEEFIANHEAYTTLSDPESRREYDVALGLRLLKRMPIVRYERFWGQGGYYSGLRWETDQCW